MDDIGSHLPTPEEMLRHLLALTPVTECHIDGYYPLGTDNCVMVVKDEHARILMTHEAASEHGDDARQFLQRFKDHGLKVTAAFSDHSQSFTEAIKSVYPHARFQADHFHTVKHIWGPLKKALGSSRRKSKARGEAKSDQDCVALAKTLWPLRWSLLKNPTNFSAEATQAIAALERADEGFVHRFRSIIRQLVHSFDHSHSDAQAQRRLQQLRNDIRVVDDDHLEKLLTFFDDHWDQALRYLRKKAWASTGVDPTRSQEGGAATAGEKPRRHPVCRHPAALHPDLSGDQVPLLRHCRVYRERPANDWAASCVKGGTHPAFHQARLKILANACEDIPQRLVGVRTQHLPTVLGDKDQVDM